MQWYAQAQIEASSVYITYSECTDANGHMKGLKNLKKSYSPTLERRIERTAQLPTVRPSRGNRAIN